MNTCFLFAYRPFEREYYKLRKTTFSINITKYLPVNNFYSFSNFFQFVLQQVNIHFESEFSQTMLKIKCINFR